VLACAHKGGGTDTRTIQGRRWKALGAICALAISALLLASPAFADTFTVNSNGDQADPDVGDGVCDVSVGGNVCTLRAAIQETNFNSPQPDTINFSGVSGQIVLTSALPAITDSVTIDGPGADQLAIDGDNTYRVLELQNGTTDSVSGLTIRNGQAPVTGGTFAVAGGIESGGNLTLDHVVVTDNHAAVTAPLNSSPESIGGGIDAGGTLTLTDSTVKNNNSTANASGTGQAFAHGGGIALEFGGTLHVDHSTIVDNQANATVTNGSANSTTDPSGGGIYQAGGTLTIHESTIAGNSATGTGGTDPSIHDFAKGGGLYQDNTGSLTITGSTLDDNSVAVPPCTTPCHEFASGANIFVINGATFQDSIVADPVGAPNCAQSATDYTSNGHNLEDDASPATTCNFTQSTDISGQNPMLGSLANNGGPTQTMKLLQGSPAIDKGNSFGVTTDQRDTGFPRISDSPTIANQGGDGSDIGAFERDSVPPNKPTITASIPKSPANNNDPTIKGLAEAGSIVRLFKTAGCTGAAVKVGTAASFHSPGFAVHVLNDTSTVFHATATDASSNTSACSNGFTYVEDSTPPNTTIGSATINRSQHRATFSFSSSEPGSRFQCKLDGQAYAPCTSPRTYTSLSKGQHTFRVRAIDKARNVDATPASRSFTI
jgi:CSLREA domain-containing protein